MKEASWFQLNQRWDGDEETRLLFADLVESLPSLRYIPHQPTVPQPWPEVTFRMDAVGVEDVPYQAFGWFLVSDRLRRLIEESELTGVNFYPVNTESQSAIRLPRFWYAHLVQLNEAIDFDSSFYSRSEVMGKPILIMVKFAFKRSAIDGYDFFRAADYPVVPFCSSRFHDLVLENKCTGMGFTPVRVS